MAFKTLVDSRVEASFASKLVAIIPDLLGQIVKRNLSNADLVHDSDTVRLDLHYLDVFEGLTFQRSNVLWANSGESNEHEKKDGKLSDVMGTQCHIGDAHLRSNEKNLSFCERGRAGQRVEVT